MFPKTVLTRAAHTHLYIFCVALQEKSAAVSMTTAPPLVGVLEYRAQGSNGNSNSNSISSSRVEAARAAAEAEAAQPYMPLLPAWRHVARRGDRDFLKNLKLELTSLEEQVRVKTL